MQSGSTSTATVAGEFAVTEVAAAADPVAIGDTVKRNAVRSVVSMDGILW